MDEPQLNGYYMGQPVWIRGSTGNRLPGTLVGHRKGKAVVKVWHPSKGKYGPLRTHEWDDIEPAKEDHLRGV